MSDSPEAQTSLEDARLALAKQKAVIVQMAKNKQFSTMPAEHMRLRQLEIVVQSLTSSRR